MLTTSQIRQYLHRITVDFNNSDEAGLIYARSARASGNLSVGDDVLATDGEGHVCSARVERLDDALVFLALDWDQFATDGDYHQV